MISPLETTQHRRIWRRRAFTAALACGLLVGLFAAASIAQAGDSKGKKVLMLQSFAAHPYVVSIIKSFRERANSYGME